MFSLIITIISIALVAVLAVATIYYGGTQFSQGSAKAKAATIVNHAQQIAGANTLFANDNGGTFATTTAALQSGDYLSAVPSPDAAVTTGAYAVSAANVVTITVDSSEVCREINKAGGDADGAVVTADVAAMPFSCNGTAFQFKG